MVDSCPNGRGLRPFTKALLEHTLVAAIPDVDAGAYRLERCACRDGMWSTGSPPLVSPCLPWGSGRRPIRQPGQELVDEHVDSFWQRRFPTLQSDAKHRHDTSEGSRGEIGRGGVPQQ